MKKKEILVEEVKNILKDYSGMKITLRQAYYRLVAKQIIENTISQYSYLSRVLVEARRNNTIPYDIFEDRTRKLIGNSGFGYEDESYTTEYFVDSAIVSLEDSLKPYQRIYYSRWYNQPYRVMVLCEKEALANIFNDVCDSKRVHFAALRGYSSETLKHEIANVLSNWIDSDLTPIILYFGDFDPTGKDIPRDFQSALKIMNVVDFQFKFCALNRKQIETWKLPPAPTKKSDSRSKKFVDQFGDMSVELDAIEPKLLKSLIESEIDKYFDKHILYQNRKDSNEREKDVNKQIKIAFKDYLEKLDLSTFIQEAEN